MRRTFFFTVILFISNYSILHANPRSFAFTYNVEVESTKGKKLELWVPIPQSNTVQKISRLRINTDGLNMAINIFIYTIKMEQQILKIYQLHLM